MRKSIVIHVEVANANGYSRRCPKCREAVVFAPRGAYALGISVRSIDYKKLLVRRFRGRVLIPVSEVRKASKSNYTPNDHRKSGDDATCQKSEN
jgi:hypothetical protein